MKRFIALLILFFSLFLIFNFSRELLKLAKSGERIKEVEVKLEKLKITRWQLQEEKKYRESPAFLEKEIRDKLLMGKPGETVVILPQEEIDKIASPAGEPARMVELPIWRQWLEVFR